MTKNRVVYREFGTPEEDTDEHLVDLPPQQQNIRIQSSRRGRGGKTVTEITGFQTTPENLAQLTKQLKKSMRCRWYGKGSSDRDSRRLRSENIANFARLGLQSQSKWR